MVVKTIMKSILYGHLRWLGMCFRQIPAGVISFILVNIVRVLAISRPPREALRLVLTMEKATLWLNWS